MNIIKDHIISWLYRILESFIPFLHEANKRYEYKKYSNLINTYNIRIGNNNEIDGIKHISIGNNSVLGNNLCIQAIDEYGDKKFCPQLVIGEKVFIGDFCHIGCVNKLYIGNNTLIARRVFISDHFHGNIDSNDILSPPVERPLSSKPIRIGNNVWIGEGACIMPGVTLGNNVIVGANAVVTHSFEDNSVIAGVPAKLLKRLI